MDRKYKSATQRKLNICSVAGLIGLTLVPSPPGEGCPKSLLLLTFISGIHYPPAFSHLNIVFCVLIIDYFFPNDLLTL